MRPAASFLALPLAALLLGGCHKEKVDPADQLPPATTTGADTFGYLLNGQPVFGSGQNRVRGDWTYPPYWSCSISKVSVSCFGAVGTYTMPGPGNGNAGIIYNSVLVRATNTIKGSVTLSRLDRQNAICSGTFWFTTVTDSGDTLRITNGRFDCHMDL